MFGDGAAVPEPRPQLPFPNDCIGVDQPLLRDALLSLSPMNFLGTAVVFFRPFPIS
jgi:hypothetical protein